MAIDRKLDEMERAKLAREYMRGGETPYQAARKCGFMRVAMMEDAIQRMEKAENEAAQQPDMDQAAAQDEPIAAPAPQAGQAETAFQTYAPKPTARKLGDGFTLNYYGPDVGRNSIYRLFVNSSPNHWIEFGETKLRLLYEMLKDELGDREPVKIFERKTEADEPAKIAAQPSAEPLAEALERKLRESEQEILRLKAEIYDLRRAM